MTPEDEIKYEGLIQAYGQATSGCPPDEYDLKQRKLLHAIAIFLLEPYFEKMEKEKE